MVKPAKMIELDPLHHLVRVDGKQVTLKPLTYALFAKLAENKNQIVTISAISQEVWDDVIVSQDTVKQRIFLLRQALKEGGVDPEIIQSVRGSGYRLLTRETSAELKRHLVRNRRLLLWAVIGIAAAIASVMVWQAITYQIPANNRAVFWVEPGEGELSAEVRAAQNAWAARLGESEKIAFQTVQLQDEGSLSDQARNVRTSLISYWSPYTSKGAMLIRAQIVEPKTETVLLSTIIDPTDIEARRSALDHQLRSMEAIIQSGLLPLSTEVINNTDHPTWAKLKALTRP